MMSARLIARIGHAYRGALEALMNELARIGDDGDAALADAGLRPAYMRRTLDEIALRNPLEAAAWWLAAPIRGCASGGSSGRHASFTAGNGLNGRRG